MENIFRQKILEKKFVISVEINPAKNGDLQQNFREVESCAEFVDAIDVTDSSMARMTPASFAVAAEIQRKFFLPAIFNFTCRDRNILGLKSDLFGALILGVENILCLTGDPPNFGDHPNSKPVFEINSCGLLKICDEICTPQKKFFAGAILNFHDDLKITEKIFELKVRAGAKFLITQPVYTPHRLEFLKNLQEKFSCPVIVGILPIRTFRTAKYLQEKVVGITIPPPHFQKMEKFSDAEIFQFQIENSREIFLAAKKIGLAGAHFMPMGRGEKIPEILGATKN